MPKPILYLVIFVLQACIYIGWSRAAINPAIRLCENPDGRLGICTSKAKCYSYVSGRDRNASVVPCSNGHDHAPHICCIFGNRIVFPDVLRPQQQDFPETSNDSITRTTGTRTKKRLPHKNKMDLFPKPPVCGPMTVGEKIFGGVEAELGEFAWLANLEYRTVRKDLVLGCAGSILNHRYILTAGHCVKGPVIGKLESIRVGDHNIMTQQDCDEWGCIPRYQRFRIIESVVHEKYQYLSSGKVYNDVALLKTHKQISYSPSVAPVCLPAVLPSMEPPTNGKRLSVGGWGYNGIANYTEVKHIVDVVYVDEVLCRLNGDLARLCAGGVLGKDSCKGDSGGSLVQCTGRGCVIEGVVSYGLGQQCATDKPSVYARVRYFLQWIQEHVDLP